MKKYLLVFLVALTCSASQQVINRTPAGSGLGDNLYTAFGKVNDNFSELYTNLTKESVLYYGAVGDGTVDCSAAIKTAALNSKVVYFPIGSYSLSTPCIITNSGVRFIGAPGSQIVVNDLNALAFSGVTNIALESLNFRGKNRQTVSFLDSKNIIVDKCNFFNEIYTNNASVTPAVLSLTTVSNAIVRNSYFDVNSSVTNYNTNYVIVALGTGNKYLRVTGNTIISTNISYSLILFNTSHSTASDNYIDQGNYGNTQNSGYGITFYANGGDNTGNTISGNYIYNTAGDGIYLKEQLLGTVFGNTITNTAINKTGTSIPASGISLHLCESIGVVGNVVAKSTQNGIEVSSGTNITISANNVKNIAVRGIYIRAACDKVIVSGNTVSSTYRGISHEDTTRINNISIIGNTVEAASNAGMYFQDTYNSVFSANRLKGTATTPIGIAFYWGGTNHVTDNTIDTSNYGVLLHETTNQFVCRNLFFRNPINSIYDIGINSTLIDNIASTASIYPMTVGDRPQSLYSSSYQFHDFLGPKTTNSIKWVARFYNPGDTANNGAGSGLLIGNGHGAISAAKSSATNSVLYLYAGQGTNDIQLIAMFDGGNSNATFLGSVRAMNGYKDYLDSDGISQTNVMSCDGTNWTEIIRNGIVVSKSHTP